MSDRLVSEEAFANTYEPAGYASGWASVEAFREWQAWQAKHPDAGRVKAGTALEMPPGRVRVWQDGGRPDAVRGLERARDRGWVDVDPESEVAEGLIRLLAWVYSSGTLLQTDTVERRPRFSVRTADERRRLFRWAGKAGVDMRVDHSDESPSGTEAVPAADGNLLGRVLVVLGAAPGQAVEYVTVPRAVSSRADTCVGAWFVATYLRNRVTTNDERPRWVQFREERDSRYHASLARLFETALGTEVYAEANTIRIETASVRSFLDRVDDVTGPERDW